MPADSLPAAAAAAPVGTRSGGAIEGATVVESVGTPSSSVFTASTSVVASGDGEWVKDEGQQLVTAATPVCEGEAQIAGQAWAESEPFVDPAEHVSKRIELVRALLLPVAFLGWAARVGCGACSRCVVC